MSWLRRLSPLVVALGATLVSACATAPTSDHPVRFTAQTLPLSVVGDARLALLDVDGDDLPELFVAHTEDAVLLQQDPNGDWAARTLNDAKAPAHAVLALDVDRDFRDDVIVARASGLTLWLNDGQGGLHDATPPAWRQPLDSPVQLAAGDADRDGWPDVYLRHADGAVLWRHTGSVHDGVPQFADATAAVGLAATTGAGEARFFDVDDDGDLDLALAGPTLMILENDGRGRFTARDTGLTGPWSHLSIADANNDGRLDVLLSGNGTDAAAPAWALNDGALRFHAQTLRGHAARGVALRAVNLDNDGQVDLLQTAPARAWQAVAGGYARVILPGTAQLARAADINRDGFTDLLALGADGRLDAIVQERHAHHWVGVRLRGQENAAVDGARVVVYMPDGSEMTQQLIAAEGELRFGLGRRNSVGGVRVYWPSGRYTQIETLGIDQHLGFVEPTAQAGRHVRLKEPLLGVQRRSRAALSCR